MLLELAKPVSLLASIVSLLAVFHAAFLGSETDLRERIFNALAMLIVAFAVSMASGLTFTQKRRASSGLHLVWPTIRHRAQPKFAPEFSFQSVIESFPMRVFYSAAGLMAAFFLAAWFIETYCIPLSRLRY
jgi:hypothetical protein